MHHLDANYNTITSSLQQSAYEECCFSPAEQWRVSNRTTEGFVRKCNYSIGPWDPYRSQRWKGGAGVRPLHSTYWATSTEICSNWPATISAGLQTWSTTPIPLHLQPRWSAVATPGPPAGGGGLLGDGTWLVCVCVHVFVQHLSHSDARSYHTSPLFVLERPMYSGASTYIPQSRMNPNEQRGTDHEEKTKRRHPSWQK